MLSGGIFFLCNRHLIHHHHSTASLKMEDRERFEEVKKAESVSTMIQESCRVLKEELQVCCFTTLRSSNLRMVQLYMSKQMDAKNMLTNQQYKLARTLYM